MRGRRPCRHCGEKQANRPKCLCARCWVSVGWEYNVDGDRDRVGYGCKPARKTPKPTTTLPGTEAKIQVMRERARKGEKLHHPKDATWDSLPHQRVESQEEE